MLGRFWGRKLNNGGGFEVVWSFCWSCWGADGFCGKGVDVGGCLGVVWDVFGGGCLFVAKLLPLPEVEGKAGHCRGSWRGVGMGIGEIVGGGWLGGIFS